MAKQGDSSEWKSSARGESAWKETREGVATRNAETRKSGKAKREIYDSEREGVRRMAQAKRDAQAHEVANFQEALAAALREPSRSTAGGRRGRHRPRQDRRGARPPSGPGSRSPPAHLRPPPASADHDRRLAPHRRRCWSCCSPAAATSSPPPSPPLPCGCSRVTALAADRGPRVAQRGLAPHHRRRGRRDAPAHPLPRLERPGARQLRERPAGRGRAHRRAAALGARRLPPGVHADRRRVPDPHGRGAAGRAGLLHARGPAGPALVAPGRGLRRGRAP